MRLTDNQVRILRRVRQRGPYDHAMFRSGTWLLGRNSNEERTYWSLYKKDLITIESRLTGPPRVATTPKGEAIIGRYIDESSNLR